MIHASNHYKFLSCRIPLNLNKKIDFWQENLRDYHDKIIVQLLEFGWPVNYCQQYEPISSNKNNSTADEYSEAVNEYIHIELEYGALARPFIEVPFLPQDW